MKIEEKYITPSFEGGSLIGVLGNAPHKWGNYFYMNGGKSVLNMWEENLEDALTKFLPDGKVKVRDYGNCLIIIDDRIPPEYYYNKLCFTGCSVSKEIAQDAYQVLGDPDNEFEQFTNPIEYHRKRGFECKEVEVDGKKRFRVYREITQPTQKLRGNWECVLAPYVVSLTGIDTETKLVNEND